MFIKRTCPDIVKEGNWSFFGAIRKFVGNSTPKWKKVFPVSVIRKLKTGLGWDFCVLVGYLCVSGVYKPGSRRLFKNRHV